MRNFIKNFTAMSFATMAWVPLVFAVGVRCDDDLHSCMVDVPPMYSMVGGFTQTGAPAMTKVRNVDYVQCFSTGNCIDQDGTYRGSHHTPDKAKYYNIYRDWYLMSGDDGYTYAYPLGEGPAFGKSADVFNPLEGTTSADPEVFDVWCNPLADVCSYGGDDFGRDALPDYFPMATDTSNCILEFCVNSDDQVVGLNPSYHLWSN